MENIPKLLPCPFCGSKKDVELVDLIRLDTAQFNKNGRLRHSSRITCVVKCHKCGGGGGAGFYVNPGSGDLTEEVINRSKSEAITNWNTRASARRLGQDPAYPLKGISD